MTRRTRGRSRLRGSNHLPSGKQIAKGISRTARDFARFFRFNGSDRRRRDRRGRYRR